MIVLAVAAAVFVTPYVAICLIRLIEEVQFRRARRRMLGMVEEILGQTRVGL